MTLKPGDNAPDCIFARGGDGAQVPLSELWQERPLIVAFLRHFG